MEHESVFLGNGLGPQACHRSSSVISWDVHGCHCAREFGVLIGSNMLQLCALPLRELGDGFPWLPLPCILPLNYVSIANCLKNMRQYWMDVIGQWLDDAWIATVGQQVRHGILVAWMHYGIATSNNQVGRTSIPYMYFVATAQELLQRMTGACFLRSFEEDVPSTSDLRGFRT